MDCNSVIIIREVVNNLLGMIATFVSNIPESVWTGFFMFLVGPLIVGVIVLVGQAFLQPWVAERVKRKESILGQRYKVCNDAFDALVRRFERASIAKGEVVYGPTPTKENLTAIEVNSLYCRLALFCSNSSVPKGFAQLMKVKSLKISDIGEFVLKVRKEMGVKGEGVLPTDFNFAYSIKKAKSNEDKP